MRGLMLLLRGALIGMLAALFWRLAGGAQLGGGTALPVALIALVAVLAWYYFFFMTGVYLMSSGRFLEALTAFQRQLRLTRNPRNRNLLLYNVANALTWAGDFNRGLAAHAQVNRDLLPATLRPHLDYLGALCLTALGQQPDKAVELARNATRADASGVYPHLLQFAAERASLSAALPELDQLMPPDTGARPRTKVSGGVLSMYPARLQRVMRDFYAGRYWLRHGDPDRGRQCLEATQKVDFANCYSILARQQLTGP